MLTSPREVIDALRATPAAICGDPSGSSPLSIVRDPVLQSGRPPESVEASLVRQMLQDGQLKYETPESAKGPARLVLRHSLEQE